MRSVPPRRGGPSLRGSGLRWLWALTRGAGLAGPWGHPASSRRHAAEPGLAEASGRPGRLPLIEQRGTDNYRRRLFMHHFSSLIIAIILFHL